MTGYFSSINYVNFFHCFSYYAVIMRGSRLILGYVVQIFILYKVVVK